MYQSNMISIQIILYLQFNFCFLITICLFMDYRTPKCTHNQRGRCFYCLTKQVKQQHKQQIKDINNNNNNSQKCKHPSNMKCLKCMQGKIQIKKCTHPDFEKCANCQNTNYENFSYYLQKLQQNCPHKKPCTKCLPFQSRPTFGIDKNCKNHIPYPQAQCDNCMAPTITLKKQQYSHVHKVIIKTCSVYRMIDSQLFGIMLGTQKKGIIQVQQIYFPSHQEKKSPYINPQEVIGQFSTIFNQMGLKQVGIVYSSPKITAFGLQLSSLFQQKCMEFEAGHQISKFVTMRLHYDQFQGIQKCECFMVSDQFQAFNKHRLLFQKDNSDDYFDLITAKLSSSSQIPTFLRQGIETDKYYFKQIIVWIETLSEQSYLLENSNIAYPFYTLQQQNIQHIEILMSYQMIDPWQKYKNIQFLLHLVKVLGIKNVMTFLTDWSQNPDLYLSEMLHQYKRKSKSKFENWNQNYY